MKYFQTFMVTGTSSFPTDMLRYDSCHPTSTDAALEISCSIGNRVDRIERFVTLGRWVESKDAMPTVGRWASFGWIVDGVHTRKGF